MGNPVRTQAWSQLEALSRQDKAAGVAKNLSVKGLEADFSHAFVSAPIWSALFDLAREQAVEQWRDDMFAGKPINNTENRAVLHTALRCGGHPDVENVLSRMQNFSEKIHAEGRFTDVVHIGIGGSDLGPRLIYTALRHLPRHLNIHFVSNVDAADITETLRGLDPQTTLFVIASKTFTTQETMMNARYAREWLGDLPVADHMIALSTNAQAVTDFGIDLATMFPFWDWVGGRYSVWSAIGMPIILAYGFDVFRDFLNGAKGMDDHFVGSPLEDNMPVCLALQVIWQRNFMKRPAVAILPYAQNLELLISYLQQLDMESNGKSVDRDGRMIVDYQTGPIIFGQAGTNGQHAFHQWLHQGTDIIPCEFICVRQSPYNADHHRVLNVHAQAQAQAFAQGRGNMQNRHRHYNGGRPSVTVTMADIAPRTLGSLLALYEHKVFVQGVIWNINSFDQWGVELGKDMAQSLLA